MLDPKIKINKIQELWKGVNANDGVLEAQNGAVEVL
jgi:hypothetical protein